MQRSNGKTRQRHTGQQAIAMPPPSFLFAGLLSDSLDRLMKRIVLFCLGLVCLSVALRGTEIEARWRALRAEATPEQLYTLLYALPKGGDLHQHAGGSNRSEWMWAILTDPQRNGGDTYYSRVRFTAAPDAIAATARYHTIRQITYDRLDGTTRSEYVRLTDLSPTEKDGWLNAFRLDAPGEGRREFFNAHWPRLGDINRNPTVRFELLVENLKAYAAEGVRYLESQFDVDKCVLADGTLLNDEAALARLEARLARPDVTALGITVRFQRSVLRFSPDAEDELAHSFAWVDAHRDRWVGINMVGIEENGFGYPIRFLRRFRELRRQYPRIALSIHAGEMDGPDKHIRDTLLLGANRIGHGVNLIQDPETLLLLQQTQRVLVEINLISNQLLEYTPDVRAHPFPEYLRTGVPVCLNTDDRGMWDSNLTDEYYTAVTTFNLSWTELVQLGRDSLRFAFVEEPVKAQLLASYDASVNAFEQRLLKGPTSDTWNGLRDTRPVTYSYAQRTWGFTFPEGL